MKCKGDIKVWVEGQRACARLTAEGSEGPIVVQASAPLADVRRRVARKLHEHGHEVSGDHPGFTALVNGVARDTALHRLEMLAPALFVPGGVATFLAVRELRRRRRARAQAKQQQELAMKRFALADQQNDDRDLYDDDDRENHDEDDDEPDQGDDAYGSSLVGWNRPRNRPPGARIGAAATDAALAVAQTTPQVRAGMTLLKLARRNPRARRHVATIVARAQDGDPRARAQVRVLAKAKRVEKAENKQKAIAARRSPRATDRALLAPARSPHQGPISSRLRDIFSAWHPELIRRRGA